MTLGHATLKLTLMPEPTAIETAITRMLADPAVPDRKKGLLRRIRSEIQEVRQTNQEMPIYRPGSLRDRP